MAQLTDQIDNYLTYCRYQKKLDDKTLKAYRIDLCQFSAFAASSDSPLAKYCIAQYIQSLHQKYKAKTAKRKIACLRAFFNYLEFDEQIETNPISKIRLDFREPTSLPKALPLATIKKLLKSAYASLENHQTELQYNAKLRDIAILELLFATGLRVSELCSIKKAELDLKIGFVKVHGKGSKERIVFISNPQTLSALRKYRDAFSLKNSSDDWFFINRLGNKLSEQSVRDMLNIHAKEAKIPVHITPHMIRHFFATLMLEEDVDIRYIQSILGHSSISTTQIYTFVSLSKQRSIMKKKHPRNKIVL